MHEKLANYLELILKWNAKTNLTAIRNPEQIVQRHFGESIFTGLALADYLNVPRETQETSGNTPRGTAAGDPNAPRGTTLLDFGSGAGFPGLPIQLLYPELHVTLAESQGKKAAFLREASRVLELNTEVWSGRVESMPASRSFDIVTMRAVDNMDAALEEASKRASSVLALLSTASNPLHVASTFHVTSVSVPGSSQGTLLIARRS